ncbi:Hypothetical protein POVN_LOCUS418 [uncultured virus]|nr:Hypothetical protein POVN_LOCUS418 [uncultured virus]
MVPQAPQAVAQPFATASIPLPPIGGKVGEDDDEETEIEEEDAPESETSDGKALVPYTGSQPIGTSTNLDSVVPIQQVPLYNQVQAHHIAVYVDFFDGYTLRQQFEFYRSAIKCAPMFFGAQGIRIIRGNNGDNKRPTLLASTEIMGVDLVDYKVDQNYWNCPSQSCHIININLAEFHGHIKNVAKKEGIRIFQYAEYPQIVICQFYGGNKNADGYVQVRTEFFEHVQYNIEDNITATDMPNVRVPLTAFCAACSSVARVKYPYAVLNVYPSGAHLAAGNETGTSARNSRWGDCSGVVQTKSRLQVTNRPPVVYAIKVPIDVIKAMTKMSNFNVGGVVKIYSKADGLARLETAVGAYAKTTCYLIE